MQPALIPPPRPELAVHPQELGVILGDLVVGQQIALGPQSTAVWHALRDGHTTLPALEAALPHLPRAVLQARLAQLSQACVLDDARWRAQREAFTGPRAAASAPGPVRLPADLRHQCARCGSSCSGAAIGPVPAETRAALPSLVAAVPGAQTADDLLLPFGTQQLMARRAEACVAYAPEDGCRIEAAAGRAAKPPACRQFPYALTRTPEGLRVGLAAECRQLLESLAAGAALDGAGVAALELELGALGASEAAFQLPDPVQLAPGVFVPRAEFLPRFEALPRELAALQDAVAAWAAERVAALPALNWLGADADWAAPLAEAAERALWDGLAAAAAEAAEAAAGGGEPWTAERFALLAKAAEHRAGRAPTPPMRPWGEGHAALRAAVVAGALAALEPVQRRDVLWGMGRLAVLVRLAEAVAVVRAARVARVGYTARDLNDGFVVASLCLRAPPLEHTLGRLAAAVRWRGAAPHTPWRPEYGFLP